MCDIIPFASHLTGLCYCVPAVWTYNNIAVWPDTGQLRPMPTALLAGTRQHIQCLSNSQN